MASGTGLTLETYEAKNLLRDLVVKRTRGEHEASFAMRYIIPTAEGTPFYGPSREGEQDVYKVELDPRMPLIKTAADRKKANFELKRHHWGAGGSLPVLVFNDESRWVATLYRDSGAPSWPDTYTTPSGLSHLVESGPERVEETSRRETEEELVFLDKGSLFIGRSEVGGKVKLSWNERNFVMGRAIVDDRKTRIDVYENGNIDEVSTPYAVGWGTQYDYVTTVVHAYVIHPELRIPRENMFLLNGEIVQRPNTIEFFSREVALLNLDDMRNKRPMVGLVHYKTKFDEDVLHTEEGERPLDEIKMTEPLRAALDKTIKMSDQEYHTWFD